MKKITLTEEECAALFDTLDELTGGSPENLFAWDGTDSKTDVTTRAWVKVFKAAGQDVPREVE